MRIGFWTSNEQPWADIARAASHAEALGYDSVWFADHFLPFVGPTDGEIHEAWTVLAALAASVPRVRLGALVTGNTYRNPAVLMKMATTVDHISNGRCVLGLGAGWQENEHIAYGIDFPSVKDRCDRLEEACEVIVSLRDQHRSDFAGDHYRLVDAPLAPKPVQQRLPLAIGGKGEKRTLRTTARFADEWNAWAEPDLMTRLGAVLEAHADDAGRDPAEIERTACSLLILSEDQKVLDTMRSRDFGRPVMIGTAAEVQELVGAYRDAGVDELIVPDFTYGELPRKLELMERFMTDVVEPLGLAT